MDKRITGYKCPICGGSELYFTTLVEPRFFYEKSTIFCNRCKIQLTSENAEGTDESDEALLLHLISKEGREV